MRAKLTGHGLNAPVRIDEIEIGGQSPVLPFLTTVRAGPHTAVRRVELSVNSQAFCIVRRQDSVPS
jgi:hypothetical protein